MSSGDLNWITNYIWGIADDVLRDVYVRGKYRDVIIRGQPAPYTAGGNTPRAIKVTGGKSPARCAERSGPQYHTKVEE